MAESVMEESAVDINNDVDADQPFNDSVLEETPFRSNGTEDLPLEGIPEESVPEKHPEEEDSTIFKQVSYLGSSTIEAPNSEADIHRVMAILNGDKQLQTVDIQIGIPSTSQGYVRLFDADTNVEIQSFRLDRIVFCARGRADSDDRECFGFSCSQGDGKCEPHSFQCHVFRCRIPEAVGKVLLCFSSAFSKKSTGVHQTHRKTNSTAKSHSRTASASSLHSSGADNLFQFEIFLEMKEEDGKGFSLAPMEKNCFKLRRNRVKKLIVMLNQLAGPRILTVQKCFGLLLAPGRNVKDSDMHLLDMQSVGRGNDDRSYVIEVLWDPNNPQFEVLNTETPRDTRVFMTIAADVVLAGIREPVRFSLECKARIFHEHERFWIVARKTVVEKYFLRVKPAADSTDNRDEFELDMFESATDRERRANRPSARSPSKMAANLISPADEDESDSDEPLLSGSGNVNHVCSDDVLTDWGDCLAKWKKDNTGRPKELNSLIRNGIPDPLRGEVWQLLSGVDKDPDMMDTYRLLLAKECPSEQTIMRDIHRTFPAHDYFKEAGGVGQDALYKLSKAYSLYDEEVGYCQGLSFLAASLLLHMPEEQAFCVLVKIMFDYNLRELFKLGFEALHLRFFQLERLIEDYIPDLYHHFLDISIETHMFASQWFLTLFTAKFPLSMVFHIIDLFLSEGINTIFHISVALLKASKKDLLQLDFESALKYFRVILPRKYRTETNAKDLIQQAVKLKISHKRLTKYEKEYSDLKKQEETTQDPLERAQKDNRQLKDSVMRLERENDDLAHELVTSKIQLRNHLDVAEDHIETLQKQVENYTKLRQELEEEAKRLILENEQVKEMCRRSCDENSRGQAIIVNYKQICSDLSIRLEKEQTKGEEQKQMVLNRVRDCQHCYPLLSADDAFVLNGGLKSPMRENGHPLDEDSDLQQKCQQQEETIRALELELAQTKLALVESECRTQDLNHSLNSAVSELHDRKTNTWLNKTISSIKEVAKNPSVVGPREILRKDSSKDSSVGS